MTDAGKVAKGDKKAQRDGNKSRARQSIAAQMLATGAAVKDVAGTLGVTSKAVHEWQHKETFKREYEAVVVDSRERVVNSLSEHVAAAVRTLLELMSAESESIRLAAAKEVLTFAGITKWKEQVTTTEAKVQEDTRITLYLPQGSRLGPTETE
jgi:transposase-like protein